MKEKNKPKKPRKHNIDNLTRKVYFYYLKDCQNRPIITFCLIKVQRSDLNLRPFYTRGVAICSRADNPCKKTGRKIAYERAMYALETNGSACPMNREEAIQVWLEDVPLEARGLWSMPILKADAYPGLNGFEKQLVEEKMEEKNHEHKNNVA